MEFKYIFVALGVALSSVEGHISYFYQQVQPRRLPNELDYCSQPCLQYLAMRKHFTELWQHSTLNLNQNNIYSSTPTPYFNQNNVFRQALSGDQRKNEIATLSKAFIKTIVGIQNKELNNQFNLEGQHERQPKQEHKPIQYMDDLLPEESYENQYSLTVSPRRSTPFQNQTKDNVVEPNPLQEHGELYQNQREPESRIIQNPNNDPSHLNIPNVGEEQIQVSHLIGVTSDDIDVKEKVNHEHSTVELRKKVISDEMKLSDRTGRSIIYNQAPENVPPQLWTERKSPKTPSQHELNSPSHQIRPELHKLGAEKATECAHLNCTMGVWTGPVCACNHVTGKVASFRNECDLQKHNCRFDTDFKMIQPDVCPWEYASRRSFSSDNFLFDYDKDVYYNDYDLL